MAASIQRDALLSKFSVLAYEAEELLKPPVNLPAGWEMVQSKIEGSFAAFVFRNAETGQVVLAFRGALLHK